MSRRRSVAAVLHRALEDQPRLRRAIGKGWRGLRQIVEGQERADIERWLDDAKPNLGLVRHALTSVTPSELRMISSFYDDTTPLPPDAEARLGPEHPRLLALRQAYRDTGLPVLARSVWSEDRLGRELDLQYFRGESPFVWNYLEWPRAMVLKYFVFAEYVRSHDSAGLLERLGEDGAFGCWTFEYPGFPRVSRDLLDSVNEILFLDRQLGLLDRRGLRVLDIGAGYGRSAHRMTAALDVADYCCVDAIPESTFVCEYYLEQRGCAPPARVVPLHELEGAVEPGGFDLAVNIHSFSECTYEAVGWWIDWIARLRVPYLLIVPNDRDQLLAYEGDGERRDFRPLVEAAGYELAKSEPVLDDPAVSELMRVTDHFLLFRRTSE